MLRTSLLLVAIFLLSACAKQTISTIDILEIKPASFEKGPGTTAFQIPESDQMVYVSPTLLIAVSDIRWAQLSRDQIGNPAIKIRLTEHAGERVALFTKHNIGSPVALMLNGQLLNAPVVQSLIRDTVAITGGPKGLTEQQVETILEAVKQHRSTR